MGSVSLRPLVVDGVQRFARLFEPSVNEAAAVLVELIVGLSGYREEGLQYAPVVFVTTNLSEALPIVRGSDPIPIGTQRDPIAAAKTALRRCAPLGEGRRWGVFVKIGEEGCEYGLFLLESSQLRPTSFEHLRRITAGTVPSAPVVAMTQLRSGVVEVRAAGTRSAYFDFTGSPEEARAPGYVVEDLVRALTHAVPPERTAQLTAFYYRICVDILTGNHGALVAVIDGTQPRPALLEDGVWLPEPVSLQTWIAREDATGTGESARALLAYAQLIRRMTMMDGVTVFGSDGTVRAYGCFLREAARSADLTSVVGGARQRAYAVLRAHVGTSLIAALYRSQDGAADCVSALTT